MKNFDLTDDEAAALTKEFDAIVRRPLSAVAAHPDAAGDPHEAPAGISAAGGLTGAADLRAADKGALSRRRR
jgi:hypothetical protein